MDTVFSIIGMAVLGIAGLAATAEVVLRGWRAFSRRFLVDEISRKAYLHPQYHPYIDWLSDWRKPVFRYMPVGFCLYNTDYAFPGPNVVNNTLGFREQEFDDTPPEDALRVVLLGGSSAWGAGAGSNAATITGRLEALLNDDPELLAGHRRARVYNLAQVNGLQTQELSLFLLYGLPLRPHVVISYNGWNELYSSFNRMDHRTIDTFRMFYYPELTDWMPLGVEGRREALVKEAGVSLLRSRSALASSLLRPVPPAGPRMSFDRDWEDFHRVTSRVFVRNLAIWSELARGLGFTYLPCLQPHIYAKRIHSPDEIRTLTLYHDVRPVGAAAKGGRWLTDNDLYDLVRKGAEDEGVAVHDMSRMFADTAEQIFFSMVHTNDRGYDLAAHSIRDEMRRRSPVNP